jgi:hypothetical protein
MTERQMAIGKGTPSLAVSLSLPQVLTSRRARVSAPGEASQARGKLPACGRATEMTGITSSFRSGLPQPNISSL